MSSQRTSKKLVLSTSLLFGAGTFSICLLEFRSEDYAAWAEASRIGAISGSPGVGFVHSSVMPIYKLAPIDIRSSDKKWAASNLNEAVWVEAPDDLAARHLVEGAALKMLDFKPGQKLIFPPWLDDVVTSCQIDRDAKAPPTGYLVTAGGRPVKVHA